MPRRIAIARLALVATAAAGLAGQAAAENRIDQVRPDAPEMAGYGDRVIGVQTLTFTDPGRVDVLNATAESAPTYDRPLTVEVWYPAADGTEPGGTYDTIARTPALPVTLHGQAARDADPAADGPYPLVIISHGYPGNRYLLAHLGETIASRGYVVASIDHTDSLWSDQAAFGSTLYNRPLDQSFVLDAMAGLDGPLGTITDADTAAVVGYSMGGYGALIFAGAGVTDSAVALDYAPPGDLLALHATGSDSHANLPDDRVRAVVAFGPWGRNRDFWDADGLSGIAKPLMIIAGGVDDISEYPAMREIFAETTGTTRHLLTFENANHNAGAPIPSPAEGWPVDADLGWAPFESYADGVWDTVRMNNVAQHFVAAFLDLHLKDADTGAYFDLIPVSNDGVVALDDAGTPTPDHTHWAGFQPRFASGLRFETLAAGD